jgi:hypothetical protein
MMVVEQIPLEHLLLLCLSRFVVGFWVWHWLHAFDIFSSWESIQDCSYTYVWNHFPRMYPERTNSQKKKPRLVVAENCPTLNIYESISTIYIE